MKKTGLVTVLYNSESVLEDFFKSLSSQTFTDIILYVIDNKSPDNSLKKARELAKKYCRFQVKFIANENNIGVAAANNQGIREAINDGVDYILVLNNDIEFGPKTLESIISYAELNNENIIVPKVFYHNTNLVWMAGGGFSFLTGLQYHIGIKKEDTPEFNKISYIIYAPTCFMLINKNVFLKTGFMDERYFVYCDDSDFCFRAVKDGYKILYYPVLDADVYHKVSVSTGTDSLFSIYYLYRNNIFFIRKHYKTIRKIIYLIIYTMKSLFYSRKYNRSQRDKMLNAMKDGFKMDL